MPILQETAEDTLFDLIACDDLFDRIGYQQPGDDVRDIVQSKLDEWLGERYRFIEPWEPEAIEICEKIVAAHY